MFVILEPFEERAGKTGTRRAGDHRASCARNSASITEAQVGVFGAPPVEGLGSTGGFKLQVQDRRGAGLRSLQGAVQNLADEGNRDPRLAGLVHQLQRHPAAALRRHRPRKGQGPEDHRSRTSTPRCRPTLGSFYVNDFTFQNRNWQVNVQADPRYRMQIDDIGKLEVRNGAGERVPLRTLDQRQDTTAARRSSITTTCIRRPRSTAAPRRASAPARPSRSWTAWPPTSLPDTMGFEWTELTLPADPGEQGPAHQAGVSAGRGVRVPGAGRAVRKLVAAAGDHPDRADVPAGGASPASGWPGLTTTSSRRSASSCWSGWRPRTRF